MYAYILVGLVGVVVLLYTSKIDNKDLNLEEAEQGETESEKMETFLGVNVDQWGWISVFTNGFSVVVQMMNLFRTQSAQSFSMPFIYLMTLLNAVYCVVGLLTLNWGLALATLFFVIYNLTVVYFFYHGKQKRS
jgi:fatty acid desaturase